MISRCTIRRALGDPNLLGRALAGDSWAPWRTLLIAAMGEELADEERELFKQLTGREHEPGRRVDELVLVVGRKGGKTRCMALLAVYLATLVDHRAALSVGERGVVLVVAQSQAVAKVLLRYAEGIIRQSPLLRSLVVNHTQDSIELKSGITIEVRPCNYKSLRGPTYCAALCDEAAFWFVDSEAANPDTEVIAAIKPALGLTHGLLTIASSPYAKKACFGIVIGGNMVRTASR
jgi:phage terminase large subunit-like protein